MPKFNFQKLWDSYPHGEAEEVKAQIGGAVNAAWITNTCAIRLSHCFNAEGTFKIPAGYAFTDAKSPPKLSTVKGGNGNRYAYRVAEVLKYLKEKLGPAQLKVKKNRGDGMPEVFKGKKGIIVFNDCGWSDATGHVDLWDGENIAHHAYWSEAKEVSLWTPDATWRVAPAANGQLNQNGTPVVTVRRG